MHMWTSQTYFFTPDKVLSVVRLYPSAALAALSSWCRDWCWEGALLCHEIGDSEFLLFPPCSFGPFLVLFLCYK